jgi:hypothetical protein
MSMLLLRILSDALARTGRASSARLQISASIIVLQMGQYNRPFSGRSASKQALQTLCQQGINATGSQAAGDDAKVVSHP